MPFPPPCLFATAAPKVRVDASSVSKSSPSLSLATPMTKMSRSIVALSEKLQSLASRRCLQANADMDLVDYLRASRNCFRRSKTNDFPEKYSVRRSRASSNVAFDSRNSSKIAMPSRAKAFSSSGNLASCSTFAMTK